MHAEFLGSIREIGETEWRKLWPGDYPFTQFGFLDALESSQSVCKLTGWQPCHLIVREGDALVAAMPLYEKNHSYGEYVFDWGWADAYHRAGIEYYPKLLNAIPFTPATGPRIGFAAHTSEQQQITIFEIISTAITQRLEHINGSTFHSLFPAGKQRKFFNKQNYTERHGCQFHWFNQNYTDFDDFLSRFNSRKRKALKKERQKVNEQNLLLQMRSAAELSEEEWQVFYALYHRTYFKRSGRQGYLNKAFFMTLAHALPQQVLLATAHQDSLDNEMLAAALYLRDSETLYGRYWGTKIDVDGLHFETCYYQGIEYAIQQGLKRFDPGAQGEHKIQRGFTPIKTCSFHYVVHPAFREAVENFAEQERQQTAEYCADGRNYLPFREGEVGVTERILLDE